jgi:shikimate kinase
MEQSRNQSLPKATIVVICGPIASGKSTVTRAVARLFQDQGTDAAAIDLDLVYDMLEHHGAPKENLRIWARARQVAAALTDALLEDGVGVIVVEGDFLAQEERAEFLSALRSSVKPEFVTLRVPIDVALQRVQGDPTRGISRDPHFLRRHYEQLEEALRTRPGTDLVFDTASAGPDEVARAIVEWTIQAS